MSDDEVDAWDKVYERWTVFHSAAFGWNGPQGKDSAAKLFVRWEHWFFKLGPTESELEAATEYLAGFDENFDKIWERHHAMVRQRILSERARLKPKSLQRDEEHEKRVAEDAPKVKEMLSSIRAKLFNMPQEKRA